MSVTDVKNTTALTPPGTETNVETIVVVPTDYKEQAETAFKEQADVTKKAGTAEQRMAYAILVYSYMLSHGKTKVTDYQLSDVLKDNTVVATVRNVFKAKCEQEFKIVRPNTKMLKGKAVDVIEKTYDKSETHSPSLFDRAFVLAYTFARDGVTFGDFDKKTANFRVKPRLLVARAEEDANITLFGRLAEQDYVLLNNASIYYTTKSKSGSVIPHNLNASVAHYKLCNKPEGTPRGARAQGNEAEVKSEASAETVAEYFAKTSIEDLGIALGDPLIRNKVILLAAELTVDDANGPVMNKDDFPPNVFNAAMRFAKFVMGAATTREEPAKKTGTK